MLKVIQKGKWGVDFAKGNCDVLGPRRSGTRGAGKEERQGKVEARREASLSRGWQGGEEQ